MQTRPLLSVSLLLATVAACDSSGSSLGDESPTVAARESLPVIVQNTAAEPVPVAITGPLAVDVGTIPAVSLSGPVTVANDAANPVPVRAVGAPVQTPWARSQFASISTSSLGISTPMFAIPAGQRLVIEFATASVWLPAGQRSHGFEISCQTGGSLAQFYVPLESTGNDYDGRARFGGAQTTKIYCDGGRDLHFGFDRNGSTGDADAYISMSGYLTPM